MKLQQKKWAGKKFEDYWVLQTKSFNFLVSECVVIFEEAKIVN